MREGRSLASLIMTCARLLSSITWRFIAMLAMMLDTSMLMMLNITSLEYTIISNMADRILHVSASNIHVRLTLYVLCCRVEFTTLAV